MLNPLGLLGGCVLVMIMKLLGVYGGAVGVGVVIGCGVGAVEGVGVGVHGGVGEGVGVGVEPVKYAIMVWLASMSIV